jgi:hypothetical protein
MGRPRLQRWEVGAGHDGATAFAAGGKVGTGHDGATAFAAAGRSALLTLGRPRLQRTGSALHRGPLGRIKHTLLHIGRENTIDS